MAIVIILLGTLMFFLPFLVPTWVVLVLFAIGGFMGLNPIRANPKFAKVSIVAGFLTLSLVIGMMMQLLIKFQPMISGWFTANALL